jgi:hypothetical protein
MQNGLTANTTIVTPKLLNQTKAHTRFIRDALKKKVKIIRRPAFP